MKKPLTEDDEEKKCQRREKRRKNNLFFLREINPQGPGEKEQSSTRFEHGPRPILDSPVGSNGKHNQSAYAEAQQQPHSSGCSPGSGTNATSSTHAVPGILS